MSERFEVSELQISPEDRARLCRILRYTVQRLRDPDDRSFWRQFMTDKKVEKAHSAHPMRGSADIYLDLLAALLEVSEPKEDKDQAYFILTVFRGVLPFLISQKILTDEEGVVIIQTVRDEIGIP